MKEIFIIIGSLLLLLTMGIGVAYLLPVKATLGILVTLHLVVLSVLGSMIIANNADKTDGRKRNGKNAKTKNEK